MTARVLGVASLAAMISLLAPESSAAPQASAGPIAAWAPSPGSAPGPSTLATIAESMPAPLAVTVIFVVLWAALLGAAVWFASQAQRLQRDLDALERGLREAPTAGAASPRADSDPDPDPASAR